MVDLTAHPDDVWERIRLGFAVPNMDAPLVVEQQAWYLSHPDFLQRAAERSSHYLYHVVEELEKRHMPTELALLPFVESAYNPMAYSRAHASGMWQFIPSTGKNFNLKQDWWHDDRRDVIASTDAALSYLQMLYEMHGDWTLALASYNWGEGSVKRAIDKNAAHGRPTDYMSLDMPDETRAYFPRLQALKNIIANPAAFGVVLPPIDNEPYFVAVTPTKDIDVMTAARLANMPVDEFRALNPAYNRPIISAANASPLLLPANRAAEFEERLAADDVPLVNWQVYRVRRGERLDRIAAHYGMTMNALCEANSMNAQTRLKPGTEILVALRGSAQPANNTMVASTVQVHAREPEPVEAGGIIRASFTQASEHLASSSYTVRRGDTLYSIAQRFHVSVDDVKRANRLQGNGLQVGQALVVNDVRSVARR
jgi:membrane-bound lytic murein transglycosylase D